ncbi:MAG: uncharacterized protein JWM09_916 [Francisellaceae bacterium]|nr:uncharacterized protein [Francisellaceae bacterium]
MTMNDKAPLIKAVDINMLKQVILRLPLSDVSFVIKIIRLFYNKGGEDWKSFPGYLCTFGGKIEDNETPVKAIIRELHKENINYIPVSQKFLDILE